MRFIFSLVLAFVVPNFLLAENKFEGSFTVEYKNEKGAIEKYEVKVKDTLVFIKNMQGGLARYNHYLLNTASREFYTVSKPEKKVVMKFDIDQLTEWYEKEQLKAGYKKNSGLAYKSTDKTKEENGMQLIKYNGENAIYKSFFWLNPVGFNFNQLIPVLRLIGCWNEAQAAEGTIVRAEVTNKISKRESSVTVTMKKEIISKEVFALPKNYLVKDFIKVIAENKDNKDLKTIVQSFAGF